jgi:hypothetical protein
MSAATRHLALLDARFGRGHPLTVPGAYSMTSATIHSGSLCPSCALARRFAHTNPPPPPLNQATATCARRCSG